MLEVKLHWTAMSIWIFPSKGVTFIRAGKILLSAGFLVVIWIKLLDDEAEGFFAKSLPLLSLNPNLNII